MYVRVYLNHDLDSDPVCQESLSIVARIYKTKPEVKKNNLKITIIFFILIIWHGL